MLSTDFNGAPRVDDPLVPNTGTGLSHADRGALDRQDLLSLTDAITPSSAQGVGPLDVTVTITSAAVSAWSEPVTFTVDFADGGGPVPIVGGSASHRYSAPGLYAARVTAADTGGSSQTLTHKFAVVTPAPPTMNVTAGPQTYTDPNGRTAIMPGAVRSLSVARSRRSWPAPYSTSLTAVSSTSMPPPTGHTSYRAAGAFMANLVGTDLIGRTSSTPALAVSGDGFLDNSTHAMRVYDSRTQGIDSVPANGIVRLPVGSLGTNGNGVDGAVVNVTVTDATAAGFLTVYPDDFPRPNVSNLNFTPGQTVANHAVALGGSSGWVDFFNGSGGPIDLIVDSYGFQTHGQGAHTYKPDGPVRVLDTRFALGGVPGPVGAGGVATFTVAGSNGYPPTPTRYCSTSR